MIHIGGPARRLDQTSTWLGSGHPFAHVVEHDESPRAGITVPSTRPLVATYMSSSVVGTSTVFTSVKASAEPRPPSRPSPD